MSSVPIVLLIINIIPIPVIGIVGSMLLGILVVGIGPNIIYLACFINFMLSFLSTVYSLALAMVYTILYLP